MKKHDSRCKYKHLKPGIYIDSFYHMPSTSMVGLPLAGTCTELAGHDQMALVGVDASYGLLTALPMASYTFDYKTTFVLPRSTKSYVVFINAKNNSTNLYELAFY